MIAEDSGPAYDELFAQPDSIEVHLVERELVLQNRSRHSSAERRWSMLVELAVEWVKRYAEGELPVRGLAMRPLAITSTTWVGDPAGLRHIMLSIPVGFGTPTRPNPPPPGRPSDGAQPFM